MILQNEKVKMNFHNIKIVLLEEFLVTLIYAQTHI